MNIAIIIGVSEYIDPKFNLPGCKNDVSLMLALLNATGKYSEILCLEKKQNSDITKNELAAFFESKKGQKVSEIFFYFTGHGEFFKNEFYYILSDFDPDRRKQTSLQNSEIDNLIKSLKPELVIKVIDACQSGTMYIKDVQDSVKSYFEKSQNHFQKCYFLNSSLTNESSYQTDSYSAFTLSFVNSILKHDGETIRYKHIIDYVSDEFETSQIQTPFFVCQADYTEVFGNVSKGNRELLSNMLSSVDATNDLIIPDIGQEGSRKSLAVLVKSDANLYASEEMVLKMLQDITGIFKAFRLRPELEDLYQIETKMISSFKEIPDITSTKKLQEIGTWLKDNKHEFFAAPAYDTETYYEELPTDDYAIIFNPFSHRRKRIAKEREFLSGFELTIDVPYVAAMLNFIAAFPNIPSFTNTVTFLISKKEVRFYYFFTDFIEVNWNSKHINPSFSWQSKTFKIVDKESWTVFLEDLFNTTSDYLHEYLEKRFR